jgi:short-subunit dehydrogenase
MTGAGRCAVVTGASSGIGEATARRLAADGWRVLAVARREDRLRALCDSLPDASWVAADLTDDGAPARVREAVEERFGALHLLVNNAGTSYRAAFGDREEGGYANVRRTMELNFDSVLRLTEELLPLVRSSAPSAIVNVSSVAGRVASRKGGAYSASKFALIGWTEALHMEERANGVHVGLVLPGFVATEGFPQTPLVRRRATRWIVSKPERVAEAILDAGPGGRPERIVPRAYAVVGVLRAIAPRLVLKLGARR